MSALRASCYVPRAGVEQRLLDGAEGGAARRLQVIQAPRGAGKTSLLRHLASRLAARGQTPVLLDLERIGSSPIELAHHLAAQVESAALLSHAGNMSLAGTRAERIGRNLSEETARRRPDPALLLDLALSYPQALGQDLDLPIVLLLDELGEVASLSRHSGLRDCLGIVARRLADLSPTGVVATVSPASRPAPLLERLSEEAGDMLERIELPPFQEREVAALLRGWECAAGDNGAEMDLWMRATGGRPLYAEILARRAARGQDLASALQAEMTPPLGALHQECRFDYHILVERSRGHAVVKTILRLLSRSEGANLSVVAQRLHISLPTALDYLSWLLEMGLIRRDGRGYVFADPLLRLWVTLHGPEPADLIDEVARFLQAPRAAPRPPSRPRGRRPALPAGRQARARVPVQPLPKGRDALIEID